MKLLVAIVFILSFLSAQPLSAYGQSANVSLDALIEETQKSSPAKDDLTIVWWIPTDFWRIALEQEGMKKPEINELIGILNPYTIVAVVDGKIGQTGKITYRPESVVRSTVRIVDSAGTEYVPLTAEKIGPGINTVMATIKPIIATALGPLGSNFHFVILPGQNAGGSDIVNAARPGAFTVRVGPGRDFTWRLPLASLVPQKTCPVDGEKMSGNWIFCPFHGRELTK